MMAATLKYWKYYVNYDEITTNDDK